ncbi:rcc1 repeat-containing protein [Anaeramoeba flamelloides]|uniref:Rcc1 repeat-containing protein n=1 Tax=Anaeramoeba flamelloides TaxID=1746091 RepID=A0AAV8ADW2_9EUKA|nr:rcc1 repeat-containing protein [Anaeramoeba flamelloides]
MKNNNYAFGFPEYSYVGHRLCKILKSTKASQIDKHQVIYDIVGGCSCEYRWRTRNDEDNFLGYKKTTLLIQTGKNEVSYVTEKRITTKHFFQGETIKQIAVKNLEYAVLINCNFCQLGINSTKRYNKPVKITKFKADQILDITSGYYHSLLLTYNGKVYTTGCARYNGLKRRLKTFKKIRALRKKQVIQISCGVNNSLALTSENQIFFGGPIQDRMEKLKKRDGKPWELTVKVHKALVECICEKKIDQIQSDLKRIKKDEVNVFIKWVYTDSVTNKPKLKRVFTLLGMEFPPKKNLLTDLEKLYGNDD